MTELKLPNKTLADYTSEQQQGKKITYTYDSTNRRVARTDETGTTQYLYGNPDHPFQLTAVQEPSGSLSIYHYDDLGLPYALDRDSKRYYIITNQLGTPELVCDENGEPIKSLEYDSFGNQTCDSNPQFLLHLGFAGGLVDIDTELVRFGFRDYDAAAGKWSAKDPIKFASGDSNLYSYVVNDPLNLIDRNGLSPSVQDCLLDCGLKQYGLNFLRDGALTASGAAVIEKSRPIGASKQTSWISSKLSKCLPQRLPKALWAPTLKNPRATTAVLGRFIGRWVPVVGGVLLVVDGVSIASCTYKCTKPATTPATTLAT